jgi:hypothetical protein
VADRSEGFNTKDTKARVARWKALRVVGGRPGAERPFVCFSSFVSFVSHLEGGVGSESILPAADGTVADAGSPAWAIGAVALVGVEPS